MSSVLFLEAFGQISGEPAVDTVEEDLYSVFRARAELVGLSTTALPRPLRPRLWGMNEAELTPGDSRNRIGFVQVGLDAGSVDPPEAMPALTQCFDDALGRFGTVELSALQITATHLGPPLQSCIGDLVAADNWFNLSDKTGVNAVVVLDQELLRGNAPVFSRYTRPGIFELGRTVTVREEHQVRIPPETPYYPTSFGGPDLGWTVTLPEWTASSIGWMFAIVVDIARTENPEGRSFAVRLNRTLE